MRARRLDRVGLEFAETAPVRLVFGARLAAPPRAVYTALAHECEDWDQWFTGVRGAAPSPRSPCGEGAERTVWLTGGVHFAERVLAADPCQRFTYRAEETTAPGVRALLEDWRLAPAGAGTRVRWTVAADGPPALRLALTAARPPLGRAFRRSMRTLEGRLRGRGRED